MMGGQPLPVYGLPVPEKVTEDRLAREYHREVDYNHEELAIRTENLQDNLTNDQRQVYNAFLEMLEHDNDTTNNNKNIMFLDAPGGTGKTYLINLILYKIRSQGKIVLATASSGIAATLLQGGRTLHSTFKVPLDTYRMDQPTCHITGNSPMAKVIRDAAAIIVDEAPMTHKSAFEAVDRTLQDITGCKIPMGGIPTLLCGDFRQILPVVKNGTMANIVNASLKKSHLWGQIRIMILNTNMRAHLSGDVGATDFARLLLSIIDGRVPLFAKPDTITIPKELCKSVNNLEELKTQVYPNLDVNSTKPLWLAERAIVSPLNTNVNKLNTWLMNEFPGEEKVYASVDSAMNDIEAVQYPVEFLNSLELTGKPSHILKLKFGIPHHGAQVLGAVQDNKRHPLRRDPITPEPN